MRIEDWLRWAGTGAFLAVAGYCVLRLVAARRAPGAYRGCHRAVDVAHVLMGVGMAAMASPVGGPLPMAGWQTVFLIMTAWFVGSWWHERRTGAAAGWHGGWHGGGLHHAAAAVAMLYMLTAMPHGTHRSAPWLDGWSEGGMASGMALPALGWTLAGYSLGAAVLLLTRRPSRPAAPAGLPAILLASRRTATAQATMALGNGSLLLAML